MTAGTHASPGRKLRTMTVFPTSSLLRVDHVGISEFFFFFYNSVLEARFEYIQPQGRSKRSGRSDFCRTTLWLEHGVCLDDSYVRAHALTVAAVIHFVDRGMDSSLTEITTQKFADTPERPLSL